MYYSPQSPESWYNLPKHLGIAYAAQESWVFNATIRVIITCYFIHASSNEIYSNRKTFSFKMRMSLRDIVLVSLGVFEKALNN